MSTQTQEPMQETARSRETKPRTAPTRKKHRVAIELTMTPSQTQRLITAAHKRYLKLKNAEKEWMDWVEKTVIEGVLDKANAQLDPAQQTDTLTLYSDDGQIRFAIERQMNRFMDGRAHTAKALIEEWLAEFEAKTLDSDSDSALVYEFLKSLFFGSQQKQFRWTPELMRFITMDPAKIRDERLKKAQRLIAESIRVDRSNFYAHVYQFDAEKRDYVKVGAED